MERRPPRPAMADTPMKATRITPTTYAVTADSLTCSRPGCRFVTRSASYSIGDGCPRCERNQVNVSGILERSTYHVDLEPYQQTGQCCCDHFVFRLKPELDRMTVAERTMFRRRCKHLKCARDEAKKDENFDALLALLPNQEEQT